MMRLALLSFLISLNATVVCAQEKIVVPLRLDQEFQQSSGQVIVSRLNDEKMIYTSPAGDGLGHAPGKVLFRVEPLNEPPHSYRLTIDTKADGDLSNDTAANARTKLDVSYQNQPQMGQRKTTRIAILD